MRNYRFYEIYELIIIFDKGDYFEGNKIQTQLRTSRYILQGDA